MNQRADFEQLKLKAQAVMADRQNRDTWSAGIRAHVEYQERPLDWIVEKLLVPIETLRWSSSPEYTAHPWDGNRDPLELILTSLSEWKDVGCESGTGCGKSFLAACIILWWIAVFENSIVSTIAPKEEQLLKFIWKEIGKLWSRFSLLFPQAELLTGTLRMRPGTEEKETWAANAFVCGVGASEDVATKAQGLHAEHLLLITEETPGIHPAIMKALYNTRTDDHNLHLALGNPDHRKDELHKFCLTQNVVHVRMSALDHPNIVCGRRIVPGAIGKRRLEDRIRDLGIGTRFYQSRVRGISPTEAEDALIRLEWCEAAAELFKDPKFREGELAIGADVADAPEGDPAAIARFKGKCCTEVQSFQVNPEKGADDVGERVYYEAMDQENPVDPRYIGIDSVGVGASAVNTLRRLGLKVRHISGGRKAVPGLDTDTMWSMTEPDLEGNIHAVGPRVIEAERFLNLRCQVWWRAREDLRLGHVALPNDPDLFEELTTPTYTTRNGMIVVESKEEIIKRLRHSPNKADAFCYGNFVRRRTPVKKRVEKQTVSSNNRDRGLERYLIRRDKDDEANRKGFRRDLKRTQRKLQLEKQDRRR